LLEPQVVTLRLGEIACGSSCRWRKRPHNSQESGWPKYFCLTTTTRRPTRRGQSQ